MMHILKRRTTIGLSLLFISLFTFLVFSNTLDNGFVNYDDNRLVYNNNLIKNISWEKAKEIFTYFTASQYCPLVLFSHTLEYAIAGLNPSIYHVNNLILHIFNCLLFFWLIYLLSRSISASTIGAFLFGIHPLHVESVAWIAERRDPLSTFFFLGALIAYFFYVDSSKWKYYYLTLFSFVLSLLSKPAGVTLPLVLLLFDYRFFRQFDKKILTEKIPFFILSIIFGVIAIIGNKLGGLSEAKQSVPFICSLLMAGKSIIFYLGKTLFPIDLSVIYPYPEKIHILMPSIFISLILLVIILVGVIYSKRYTREILFGSAFFLITLLPILDIIPRAGIDFAADRYMYIPSIGLFYLAGLGWDRLYRMHITQEKIKKGVLIFLLIISIGFYSFLAFKRNDVWQDSGSLWQDVISKYPGIALAYNNLGAFYLSKGESDAAIREFKRALELQPDYADAHNNLGLYYGQKGEYREAIVEIKKALAICPGYLEALNNLGMCYHGLGLFQEAIGHYKKGLAIQPNDAEIHNNLGDSYLATGRIDEAAHEYKRAIGIDPRFIKAHENLGILYGKRRMFKEAIAEHKIVLSLDPDNAKTHYHIAVEYYFNKKYEMAVKHCEKAIEHGYNGVEPVFLKYLEPLRKFKKLGD